jgi:hypothetical protein
MTSIGAVLGAFLPPRTIGIGPARLAVPLILTGVAAAVLTPAGVAVLSLMLLGGLTRALTWLALTRLSLTGLTLYRLILVPVVVLSAVSHRKLLR